MTNEQLIAQVQHLQITVDYLVAVLKHHGFVPPEVSLTAAPTVIGSGTNLGQRQIASDPMRTDVGMGPIVNPGKSNFV